MKTAEASAKRVLEVHMLGECHITLDGEEVKLPGGIYSKTMRLFLLIVYHGEKGISRQDVLGYLYGDGDYSDDSGSLRVALFRLKKQLISAGILSETDIINHKGTYRIEREDLEVAVDAKLFEDMARKALNDNDNQEKQLEEVCRMYTGEFLPSLSAEIWVAGKQARYQNLYFRSVRRYLKILAERESYERMLVLAKHVQRLYPYDEWYVAELDALIGMGRWKEAQEASRQSARVLMERMGLRPSEEMEKRIRKINNQLQGSFKNLQDIRRELEETENEDGALCCNYNSFMETYRYETRKIERSGESLYLVLSSLMEKENSKYSLMDEGQFEQAVVHFGEAVRVSLRRADMYTRYGKNQYLMLLGGLKQEDCSAISSRIEHNFEKNIGGSERFRIQHFITPVTADMDLPDKEREPIKFSRRHWQTV